eukprot:3419159-Amphidinium_carterae.1
MHVEASQNPFKTCALLPRKHCARKLTVVKRWRQPPLVFALCSRVQSGCKTRGLSPQQSFTVGDVENHIAAFPHDQEEVPTSWATPVRRQR